MRLSARPAITSNSRARPSRRRRRSTRPRTSSSVIAAGISVSSADFGQLGPMINAAERELTTAGITTMPEVVLADAGYWHTDQMEAIVSRGMQVLIPPDASKRKGARPGWDGGLYA